MLASPQNNVHFRFFVFFIFFSGISVCTTPFPDARTPAPVFYLAFNALQLPESQQIARILLFIIRTFDK